MQWVSTKEVRISSNNELSQLCNPVQYDTVAFFFWNQTVTVSPPGGGGWTRGGGGRYTQHAGCWGCVGRGGCCSGSRRATTVAGYGLLTRGSCTPSVGAELSLQESVVQSDREALSPSGSSRRSGVIRCEFSVLYRAVVAVSPGGGGVRK